MRQIGLTERTKINKGVRKKAVIKEKIRANKLKIIIGAIIALVVIIAFVLYFYVLSPMFVAKPSIEKIALVSASNIETGHIDWMLNELGAYKLHSYLLYGEPTVIECVITDQNKAFATTIIDNRPVTGTADYSPDVRFSMTGADFVTLYAASDFLAKAQEMRESGLIKVDLLKDDFTLAVKGYKAIYDALPGLPW